MTTRAKPWISRAGFAIGAVLATAVLAAGQVPAGGRALQAQVNVSATATGGLAVSPEGRALAKRRLTPGAPPLVARVRLLNQTSGTVQVLVRAASAERALDASVRVELRAGAGRPLRATLGELRRWRRVGAPLAAHRRTPVALRIWIPRSASGAHEGRRADVTLEFLRRGAST